MTLPEDYFLDTDDEMLSYLEKQAEQHILELRESNARNKENATKLFNLLLAGAGGAFLLLVSGNVTTFFIFILIATIIGWGGTAIYLSISCLITKNQPHLYNPPDLLYTGYYKNLTDNRSAMLSVLRRYRLNNYVEIAKRLRTLNTALAKSLDKARVAAVTVPITLVLFLVFSIIWA
ncbi:hypothetical protein [Testudinibacter sp. TR-2022]|uniref:hypothetical protein n=1 Tax=Testudinibacter sp. TR-2022 TaxID=2585029 RepID=UPI00111ACEE2|nr:hypothetical protein [Testudinibacter sp. TR-2022]TNH06627.1 hypothetical protein FHQ30_07210 [Pasteurellaceae bacterium Phil11]TNH25535.1 hypothetical protein FHQ29_01315 [Testudinibacter sp. TR-2022]TNH25686.1 hypothetical protein FHQ27_08780 [Testudinibacter sp. TR-2022]